VVAGVAGVTTDAAEGMVDTVAATAVGSQTPNNQPGAADGPRLFTFYSSLMSPVDDSAN
jgi:hypothetical protein